MSLHWKTLMYVVGNVLRHNFFLWLILLAHFPPTCFVLVLAIICEYLFSLIAVSLAVNRKWTKEKKNLDCLSRVDSKSFELAYFSEYWVHILHILDHRKIFNPNSENYLKQNWKKKPLKVIQNLSVDIENSVFLMWRWKIIFIFDNLWENVILGGANT